jgi:hypothetical protein
VSETRPSESSPILLTSVAVIEAFLVDVRIHLGATANDADSLIDEVRDHLWESIEERHELAGDPDAARSAVAELGDPAQFAHSLAVESSLSTLAHRTTVFGRWCGIIASVVIITARFAVVLDRRRGLGRTDGTAVAVSLILALGAGALAVWSARDSRRLQIDWRGTRRLITACGMCGGCIWASGAVAIGLDGDLVADAVRNSSVVSEVTTLGLAMVLAAAITVSALPLRRLWRALPHHSDALGLG